MDARAIGLPVVLAGQIGDDDRQWIEVMPTATKARNGKFFFTVTREDLETLAQSIADQPGLIPVDFDHEGARSEGSTKAAGWFTGETRVEDRDSGSVLMAEVKWTPAGAKAVRDGEFKRTSPEWNFHERDSKTGLMTRAKQLIASTLTNRPFFKELAPVGATLWSPLQGTNRLQQMITASLNPSGDYRYWVMDVDVVGKLALICEGGKTWVAAFTIDGDDVSLAPSADWQQAEQEWVSVASSARAELDAITLELFTVLSANKEPYGDVEYADPGYQEDGKKRYPLDTEQHIRAAWSYINKEGNQTPYTSAQLSSIKAKIRAAMKKIGAEVTATSEGDKMPDELKAVATALGLDPETATEDTVTAALKTRDDELTAAKTELEALKASAATGDERIKAIEDERRAEKIETALATAVTDNKIDPAQKPVLAEQFAENLDGLVKLLETFPARARKATGGSGAGAAAAGETNLDEIEIQGSEYPVGEDGAIAHAKAIEILTAAGKKKYTADEYLDALDEAQTALAAA